MSLPRHIYQALESVVGPEYISDAPHIMAGYRRSGPHAPLSPRPEAVLLPATSEEVQAIVKICNRYDLAYIATVSGLSLQAYPDRPSTIVLHLKRMNRIVEINETDRYAVIEPGVRHGQLKPELMKRGLTYAVASVGPGGSVLANFTVTSGDHHNQNGLSRTNRYLLGVEWVTPTGDIVRTGSLGAGAGWFCPEGPGPSLRGLIKGYYGSFGGMGIITRIAIGLDASRGPEVMSADGRVPKNKFRLPRDRHRAFIFKFPDLDKVRDAMLEVGKAEIGHSVIKFFNATYALLNTESANDFWQLWDSGLFQRELSKPLYVYLTTWSEEEMEYEERVLREIVAENGGEPVDGRIQQILDDNMDFYIIVSFLQRTLRLGGGWAPNKLSADSITHMFEVGKAIPPMLEEFIDDGRLLNAPDNFQISAMEYAHMAHIELLFIWDFGAPDWPSIPADVMTKSAADDIAAGRHAAMPGRDPVAMRRDGPLYSGFDRWAFAIKDAFDPNAVSNPSPEDRVAERF
ncbi:MAG: FAD-binding oxidoreductase [Actinomycetia bacterium]|nr:FAD-binding oxidoreductase [Actinomycetes bacterium]